MVCRVGFEGNSSRVVIDGWVPRLARIEILAMAIGGKGWNHFKKAVRIGAWPIAEESHSTTMTDKIMDIAANLIFQLRIAVGTLTDYYPSHKSSAPISATSRTRV